MRRLSGGLLVAALLALALLVAGCSQEAPPAKGADTPAEKPAPSAEEKPKAPEYKSWVVYINDDDSYTEGPITYEIALNFTATNPTPYINGTYKGNATASTSTNGTVSGKE